MKLVLLTFFSTFLLSAEVRILKGEKRDIPFTVEIRDLKSKSDKIYYMYGVQKFISNGSLNIKFKIVPNIKRFSNENNLKLIRKNSTGTYLFLNLSHQDIISKSNSLQDLDFIQIASPSWNRGRSLK